MVTTQFSTQMQLTTVCNEANKYESLEDIQSEIESLESEMMGNTFNEHYDSSHNIQCINKIEYLTILLQWKANQFYQYEEKSMV